MGAYALLNLLNQLRKRDKSVRLSEHFSSLFHNKFDKFNKTKARMLDSIYHVTLRLLLKSHFCHKNIIILSLCTQRCYGCHNVSL